MRPRERMSGLARHLVWAAAALLILPRAVAAAAPPASPVDSWRDVPMPFVASPEILEAGRHIARLPGGPTARLDTIVHYIFDDPEGLRFTYRSTPTLTAAEAMRQRAGNCLTLVNLFIALARAADLDAYPMEVEDFVSFSRRGETLLRSTHVVGGVAVGIRTWTFDFLPGREKRYRRVVQISDTQHAALYYNAIAVEAMLAGRIDRAEELFAAALVLEPGAAETWNNYAMLARRAGDIDEAVRRLECALRADPRSLPALTNLARLCRRLGDGERAARLEARALKERQQNPYFLLEESLREIARGDLAQAEALLKNARRIDGSIPEIHVALGRIDLLRGDPTRAARDFEIARKRSRALSVAYQHGLEQKVNKLLRLAGE